MAFFPANAPPMGLPDLATIYVSGQLGAPGVAVATGSGTGPTVLPSVTLAGMLGSIIQMQDTATPTGNVVNGGGGAAIFLAIPTSTTTTKGLLYYWKGDYTIVVVPTSLTTTTTSGSPVAVAMASAASNASSVQYGWFQIQGRTQLLKASTITIQPNVPLYASSATAGRVRGTASIFRLIIGARSANTATIATGNSIVFAYLSGAPAMAPGL